MWRIKEACRRRNGNREQDNYIVSIQFQQRYGKSNKEKSFLNSIILLSFLFRQVDVASLPCACNVEIELGAKNIIAVKLHIILKRSY